MQKLFLLFLFQLSLLAQNPKVYASLGDAIYDNVNKVQSLKQIKEYEPFYEKIDLYTTDVKKAKIFGFEVQSGAKSNLKLDYLKEIRKLSLVNDYFSRTADSSLKSAIQTNNNSLFIGIINSGLINIQKNKNKIMRYYNQHKADINPEGTIQDLVDEAYAKKHKKKYKPKTKKQKDEERLKKIRKNDKLKQIALEKKLTEEVEAKKQKIRKEHEKELFH